MSDGPHRSLPMRPAWKRVAECGDNHAFASDEVSQALTPALQQDCRDEIPPQFIDAFTRLYPSLLKEQLGSDLEALRPLAGSGIGRVVLEHAIQLAASGDASADAPVSAMVNALTDRAGRGARQVEEHYHRESTQPRAHNVRARIEQAISASGAAILALSRAILKIDQGTVARLVKQQDVDDGVRF